jgi:hypothetical protein
MNMLTNNEIDNIIRAYFDLKANGTDDGGDIHRTVVSILSKYPEYAYFFLTTEELEMIE